MSDTRVRRIRHRDEPREGDRRPVSARGAVSMSRAAEPTPFLREEESRASWLGYGVLALVVVLLLGVAGGMVAGRLASSRTGATASVSAEPTPGVTTPPVAEGARLYPDRPDARPGDREPAIGEPAAFAGYTAAVEGASFQQTLGGQFVGKGYVVADVWVANRATKAQRYDESHWQLQTPTGPVIDRTYDSQPSLGSGDLAAKDGRAAGRLIFEVGTQKGDFYIMFAPDPAGADRAVWKVAL